MKPVCESKVKISSIMKRKRIENFVIFLNEELGKGSFGKVYKGVNELTQQPVAIKALPRKMSKAKLMQSTRTNT